MLRPEDIDQIVTRALAEDLPDITSDAIFGPEERSTGSFLSKGSGILGGVPLAVAVFARLDPNSTVRVLRSEAEELRPGDVIAEVNGTVRALLAGERTALNLMQRVSGIATETRRYVEAVRGTPARIYDTRKTAPGLRAIDKYAVTVGGGFNHRQGLFDMFLIKNNHIDRAGSLGLAVERVRESGKAAEVMVEVRSLEELEQALAASPDSILLDNMDLATIRAAVVRCAGRLTLEASGGVSLETVRAIAGTGVDRISIGALTHSVRALDISFRVSGRS